MPLAILCGCTAWFVSDLVGNPEDRFSKNEAHMTKLMEKIDKLILTCWMGVLSLPYGQPYSFLVKSFSPFLVKSFSQSITFFFYFESRCALKVYTCLSATYGARDSRGQNPVFTTLLRSSCFKHNTTIFIVRFRP